uniref:Small ribosomal subunit protein mS41 SAM domain-containing protein n=1 Tax=Leersia perrieri TaxID=77586 RepID=A0A0D9V015_9ORYZ
MAHACASHVRRLLAGAGAPARSLHSQPYQAKVGVVEFLNGVGKGVGTHAAKVEEAVGGDIQKLLETRTLRLKKLGIPCKHRKLILSFAHKYRLGLWKPRAQSEPKKAQ